MGNAQKGFGFIKPDDGGDDIFAHVSGITDGSMLAEGSTVSYVKQYDDRRGKERAEQITGGNALAEGAVCHYVKEFDEVRGKDRGTNVIGGFQEQRRGGDDYY